MIFQQPNGDSMSLASLYIQPGEAITNAISKVKGSALRKRRKNVEIRKQATHTFSLLFWSLALNLTLLQLCGPRQSDVIDFFHKWGVVGSFENVGVLVTAAMAGASTVALLFTGILAFQLWTITRKKR